MQYPEPLVPGILIKREKRFLVHVRLDSGETVIAHTNNTGTMLGCNTPGSRVWLSPADNPKRKLKWTYELIETGEPPVLVGINTILANRIVREGLEAGVVPELAGFERLRAEVKSGEGSRIDFMLESGPAEAPTQRTWVEVKNVTLVEDCVALFPDAVTERGRKHLGELMRLAAEGDRACMLYLVQRGDAKSFAPAKLIDPAYAAALKEAVAAGVEILPWRARVTTRGIALERPLPLA